MRDSSRRKENGMQSEAITYERLRAALTGRVIGPDDQDYDEARTIFYGGFDRSPAAIARVADANDWRAPFDSRPRRGRNSPFEAEGTASPGTARPTAASCSTWPR